MTIFRLRIATLLAALALLAPAGRAEAAELKVLSTIALGEAWHELQPRFEATRLLTPPDVPSTSVSKIGRAHV